MFKTTLDYQIHQMYDGFPKPVLKSRDLFFQVAPECQEEMEKKGYCRIQGKGKRAYHYELSPFNQTIILRGMGRRVGSACLQLTMHTPVFDRVLAEYLLLRNNEDLYWHTANVSMEEWITTGYTRGTIGLAVFGIVLITGSIYLML